MNSSDPPGLPDANPDIIRRVGVAEDLVALFRERAREQALRVLTCGAGALADDLVALLIQLADARTDGPLRVIIEPSLMLSDDLQSRLPEQIVCLDPHRGDDALFAADVGVTGVAAAVAETGSIVCTSGVEQWRGLSLIPTIHIAVVYERQIAADLFDLFQSALPDELPANVNIISGPSKTADIEGVLVTGVHGPREVHVMVVTSGA